jgi:hypothetical protein
VCMQGGLHTRGEYSVACMQGARCVVVVAVVVVMVEMGGGGHRTPAANVSALRLLAGDPQRVLAYLTLFTGVLACGGRGVNRGGG